MHGCCKTIIPKNIAIIGRHAFWGCESLQILSIPNSVVCIGTHAFGGCKSLQTISIPNSVTSIGKYAFDGCKSLYSINIPRGSRKKFEEMLDENLWDKLVEL